MASLVRRSHTNRRVVRPSVGFDHTPCRWHVFTAASIAAATWFRAFGFSTTPCNIFTSEIFFVNSLRCFAAIGSVSLPASSTAFTPAHTSATVRLSCDTLQLASRDWCRDKNAAADVARISSAAAAATTATGGPPSDPDPPPPPPPPCAAAMAAPAAAAAFAFGDAPDCLNGKLALQCGHMRVGDPTTPWHSWHSLRPFPNGVPGLCAWNVAPAPFLCDFGFGFGGAPPGPGLCGSDAPAAAFVVDDDFFVALGGGFRESALPSRRPQLRLVPPRGDVRGVVHGPRLSRFPDAAAAASEKRRRRRRRTLVPRRERPDVRPQRAAPLRDERFAQLAHGPGLIVVVARVARRHHALAHVGPVQHRERDVRRV